MRGLRHGRCIVIANGWGEGRDEHERAAQEIGNAVFIRRNPYDAFIGKAACTVRQKRDGLQHIISHDGLENVQLEMPLRARNGHCCVIAHDLCADHGEGFALSRVDLTRHDGAARLICGQADFTETGARAGGEEADVIGDFIQADRDRVQRAMGRDKSVMRGEGFEFIWGGDERQSRVIRDLFGEALCKSGFGVEACADGCAALGEGFSALRSTCSCGRRL